MEKIKEDNFIVNVCGKEICAAPQVRVRQATFLEADGTIERPAHFLEKPMTYNFTKRLMYFRVLLARMNKVANRRREDIYLKCDLDALEEKRQKRRRVYQQRYQERKAAKQALLANASVVTKPKRKGVPCSPEKRAKISAAMKLQKWTPERSEKMKKFWANWRAANK